MLGWQEDGSTCIRQIDPGGRPLRRVGEGVDGFPLFNKYERAWAPDVPKRTDWDQSLLLDALSMVRDPATGTLYVALRSAILQITPDGRRTSLLGVPSAARTMLPVSGTPVPLDLPCLGQVGNLALRGDELYFFDEGEWFLNFRRRPQPIGLCAFNLTTRVFRLLVATPEVRVFEPLPPARDGVLAIAWPGAPEPRQARLDHPTKCFLVFRPDGTGLVGTRDALFTLDLDLEPLPPRREAGSGGPGAAGESKQPREGPKP